MQAAAVEQLLQEVQRALANGTTRWEEMLVLLCQPDMLELWFGATAPDVRLGIQLLHTLKDTPALLEAAYQIVPFVMDTYGEQFDKWPPLIQSALLDQQM